MNEMRFKCGNMFKSRIIKNNEILNSITTRGKSTLSNKNNSSCKYDFTEIPFGSRKNRAFKTKFNPMHSAGSEVILPKGKISFWPSAAPKSPYDTPQIFLPNSEIAKENQKIWENCLKKHKHFQSKSNELPPPLSTPKFKKYNLSSEDAIKIINWRKENPKTSHKVAAKLFNCSQFITSRLAPATFEKVKTEKIEKKKNN